MTRETVHSGWFARWLFARGWRGVTLPGWRCIRIRYWADTERRASLMRMVVDGVRPLVVTEEWASCVGARAHEQEHVPQLRDMGVVRYLATILWQYKRYGHDDAPMEQGPRAAGKAAKREAMHAVQIATATN